MNTAQLRQQLTDSESNEQWVDLLAQFFAAYDLFYGHGTDNAVDEAYWLLRHLQQWNDAAWKAPADPVLAERVATLAQQRVVQRKPLAYLLNEAWFAGLKFFVDERVLVPRSPFAEIIQAQFAPWVSLNPGDRALEIGTGSGCIAIASACYCPDVIVDATDISAGALQVAAINVRAHGVTDRVNLLQADLFPSDTQRYRVIMSNPPYVSESDYAALPAEYRHEPRMGLVGGPSGLAPTWRLLAQAGRHLTADGVVIVEVGNEAQQLADTVPGLELTWIEFEHGGEGVFVLTAAQLEDYLRHATLPQSDE